ncbi:uncharacterized protein LOC127266038 isoform X2 [Andrographis paniculata]|nr:uncharacterized protein LOC127266038 isoform X2 [Andrographis paniculata]XP_051152077.1 uncharacterized protein LOC127266038 isoform X2 [Andrographis paniculata]
METREGFSIREYALGMRSVHVVKCWPFDEIETSSEESVRSMLPPITVKNFVWWIDLLQYVDAESTDEIPECSAGKKKKKKKKKSAVVVEKGESSSRRAEEIDISDSEDMAIIHERSSRSKAKPQKKRSILEIFAAAQPVERVSTDEEDNGFHVEDGFGIASKLSRREETNWGFEGKTKKKFKKYKKIISSKLKKATNAINKIKKRTSQRGDNNLGLLSPRKVDCSMLKLQDHDDADRKGSSRKNDHDINNGVSICDRGKNTRQQLLNAANRGSSSKAFRWINAQSQPRTNLKPGILRRVPPLDHDVKENADKQVKFLEKGNHVKQQKKPLLLEESYELQLNSMHIAHSPESLGKDLPMAETIETNRMEDKADFRTASRSTIPLCPADSFTFQQCKKKDLPGRSITCKAQDLNDVSPSMTMNVTSVPSSSTGRVLIKDLGVGHNVPSVLNFEKLASNISQPGYLLQSVCSPADGYRTGIIFGKRIGNINEDLVRLPLNSKGELLVLSSNSKGGLNESMARNMSAFPSIGLSVPNKFSKCLAEDIEHRYWDHRISSRDASSLIPSINGSYLRENQAVIFQSMLGMNDQQCNGKTNLAQDLTKFENPAFYREDFLCKESARCPSEVYRNDKIFPTMRLMGKEFTVGAQGFQEFENRHIWKDKQMMDELGFSNMPIDNRIIHNRNDPSAGKLRETLFHPTDTTAVDHSYSDMASFPGMITSEFDLLKKQDLRPVIKSSYMHPDHSRFSTSLRPYLIPGVNCWADLSAPLKPKSSCVDNPHFLFGSTLPSCPIEASSSPTLLTQHVPAVYPISSVRKRHGNGNQNAGERINSRVGFAACHHGGGIAKRRPSSAASSAPLKLKGVKAHCDNTRTLTNMNLEDVQKMIETTMESESYGGAEERIHSWTDSCSCIANKGDHHSIKITSNIDQSSSGSRSSSTQYLLAPTPDGWQQVDLC